jgi:two-component system cell cycle sensor histidine kinase/response regulator CckA
LAGGIAHDFNNLLTVILGNAEMLQMMSKDETVQLYSSEVAKAADRAATLTRQLLAFSRKTVMQMDVIDLNSRVGNLKDMFRRLIGEDIQLSTNLYSESLCVKADASQIDQVVMNLVVNARDAMPDGGDLKLETSIVLLDPTTHLPAPSGSGRSYAQLCVKDTGTGMDDHVKNHLFEPFFTTKEQGKGTGLGLAMVYGIVQQSEGHIEVTSVVGQGTTFNVYLPLSTETCRPERGDRRTQRIQRGTETILLVEDEEGVRALAANALRINGYQVLECTDGAKAMALCDSFDGVIHMLITDVVMPCVGGVDLARHFRKRYPGRNVLFMSGYPDSDFVLGVESASYIQKPFSAQELSDRVRNLLDTRTSEPIAV